MSLELSFYSPVAKAALHMALKYFFTSKIVWGTLIFLSVLTLCDALYRIGVLHLLEIQWNTYEVFLLFSVNIIQCFLSDGSCD